MTASKERKKIKATKKERRKCYLEQVDVQHFNVSETSMSMHRHQSSLMWLEW